MKKISLAISLLLILLLPSCTVQERVSPLIFIDRLNEISADLNFISENSYYDDNVFISFLDFKDLKSIAIKMQLSDDNSIIKISLITINNSRAFELIKLLIETYSPEEDSNVIFNELTGTEKGFCYSFGNEYTYSVFKSDKEIYFEVFINSQSDYSVPDLTLKSNDKIKF